MLVGKWKGKMLFVKRKKNKMEATIPSKAAQHWAIPQAYPPPRGTEGLVSEINYNDKGYTVEGFENLPEGEDFAHMGLLAHIGE